jgi:hypothetical protein
VELVEATKVRPERQGKIGPARPAQFPVDGPHPRGVTPADAYFGRADTIISERRRTKDKTMKRR